MSRSRRGAQTRSSGWAERQLAPPGVPVYNPAFGATPLDLVTAITLEQGIYRLPEMPDLGWMASF